MRKRFDELVPDADVGTDGTLDWMPTVRVLVRVSVTATVCSVLFCAPSDSDVGSSSTPRSIRLPPTMDSFLSVT